MSYTASHPDLYDMPPDAMRAAVGAVEILGASGCVEDYPPQRMMREAKIMQIDDETGTQRVEIAQAPAR
jgi:alkylation response protein AidB-like acyl-CoA dehydrogenase